MFAVGDFISAQKPHGMWYNRQDNFEVFPHAFGAARQVDYERVAAYTGNSA